MFGVVDRLFFRPPALVKDADRIREVDFVKTSRIFGTYTTPIGTYPRLADFQSRTKMVSQVAAYSQNKFSLGLGERAQQVESELVSKGFFALTGVQPALGRFFTDDENTPDHASHVVVLSAEFWKRQFGGSNTVLGTTMQLGRSTWTVIGVAPRGF